MYLIATTIYPNDKAKEVANVYLKAMTKYPENESVSIPIVPVAVRTTLQGIRVINVYEVKKGKFEDAHALAINRFAMFNDIPGYRWTMKTYQNLEEALKTIGM
jgi:hypothetical protein